VLLTAAVHHVRSFSSVHRETVIGQEQTAVFAAPMTARD
jgi:gamma-glutamyl phosphate reductase